MVEISAEQFVEVAFDYIVIGGGAGGLPVGNRLSEDPAITVGVLEAGLLIKDDPLVEVPGFIGRACGNPKYDWAFETAPQEIAGGRTIPTPRGKMLGGSTGLNHLAWDRASRDEYDAWKLVANGEDGWDWDSLLPYFRKSEDAAPESKSPDIAPSLSRTEKDIYSLGVPREEACGVGGPVKTSYNTHYSDLIPPYIKAWNSLNQKTNANIYGGHASGIFNIRHSRDFETGKRVDASGAYYTPVSSRTNFKILTGAHVTKVVFDPYPDAEGNVLATGVEFIVDGKKYVARAAREVIISAGAVQTPQILELSGIGDRTRLAGLGIEPLVNLPGVGENLTDHVFTLIQYVVKQGVMTLDEMRNNPEFMEQQQAIYDSTRTGWLANTGDSTALYAPLHELVPGPVFASLLDRLEGTVSKATTEGSLSLLEQKQHEIQLKWLKQGQVPHTEIILFSKGIVNPEQGLSYCTLFCGIQHPFSRGSVHINTTDPLQPPVIDPRYLTHEFANELDMDSLVTGYRATEKVAQTEPFKSVIERQSFPPVQSTSDEEHLKGYIRQAFLSGSHLMGTAAIARRDIGGVVGNDLRVYGTRNVRVSDASIIPLPMACHIQATVYAIAEKAADIIKRDW